MENSNDVLEAMKRIEWQKAKGHLRAMLEAYRSPVQRDGTRDTSAFGDMSNRIEIFINQVEDRL
jgi:hypothetical protein